MANKNLPKDSLKKDEFIDLGEIIKVFTKNKKWFIISFISFVSIGMLYLLMKNPVYEVNGTILLRQDDKKSSSAYSSISALSEITDLGSMMNSSNVDNEVVVLNTRQIMTEAICKLNQHVVSKAWQGLKRVDLYPKEPFIITTDSLLTDTLSIPIKFTIKPTGNNQYLVKGKVDDEKFQTTIDKFPVTIKTPILDVFINQNPDGDKSLKEKKIDVTINNPNILAVSTMKTISISPTSKKTSTITFSTEADNVKKAQDLIKTIINLFNDDAVKDKNLVAQSTAAFVDERLKLISQDLISVEKEKEKYKQDNQLTDISSEAKLFLEQMGEYEKLRTETQIQLSIIDEIKSYIEDPKNKNQLIPSIGIEDKNLIAVIAKYNELLIEKIRIEKVSSNSNPALGELSEQLIILRQNISANVNNVKKSLQIAMSNISKQDMLTNARIKSIPRQEREYIEIERQHQIKEALYLFLLQKREETSLSLAATSPKAKLIDKPMPSVKPIAPRKIRIMFILMAISIIVPFCILYLRNMLKKEIESKEELEKLCDAEVIGEICENKSKEHIVVKPHETSTVVELFRLLRTNLMFILNKPEKKVILLTSTIAGEGKSFVSINLAVTLALTKKKVLLIGLDIRSPKLGEYMQLKRKTGITNFLSSEEITIEEIIQHSGIQPELDVIQAGPIPPNPNELLMSGRLDKLFSEVRKLYDYIIVDSAPVGIVSDSFQLDRVSDVTLYVSRIGHVHKDSIRYINSIKASDKLKELYIVANGIDLSEKNGGYGYGYGHKK